MIPAAGRAEGSSQASGLAKALPFEYLPVMSTINVSLPDALKSFVDEQVAGRGYSSSSEYVRELIRADQERQQLRKLLLDSAASPATAADDAYFNGLRDRVRFAGAK
jgi:antitoxin ParD1/3/4